ncbi:AGAP006448-PC, related, partial [Eimeria necatrix]
EGAVGSTGSGSVGSSRGQLGKVVGPGDVIGELALLYNSPRAATVVTLLQSMSTYDRLKLADALRTETYSDGEFIVRQGEEGNTFYLVEDGKAKVFQTPEAGGTPVQIGSYQSGDYFGELALLTGEARAANVVSDGFCKVAALERKSFKRLLGSVEEILRKRALDYKRK